MAVIPVTIGESTAGPSFLAANQEAILAIVGTASSGDVNTPRVARSDGQPAELFEDGPLVEYGRIVVGEGRQPAVLVRAATTTPGAYGVVDDSLFSGTAVVDVDATTVPNNAWEGYVEFITGGVIGTAGISYRDSLDSGRKLFGTKPLGGASSILITQGNIEFTFAPPAAQVTAFIAAVVEARADTLAHLANVVAHDAADTSAAQIALAASSPPTTGDEAWVVMNLVADAYFSHRTNITVHNGPDPVNVIAHAPATDVHSGIDLYVEYRTDYNAHLGIALAAAPAGLRVATATVASPVTLTSDDLLDPGEALLAVYPRRLTFTTGGVTPSDAPADVDIVGTGFDDAPLSETLILSQIAGAVTSVNAYKTITTLDFPAADGTDATIAIGYDMGVHNSADVTNLLSSAVPTHGTVVAGDIVRVATTAPLADSASIASALATLPGYNGHPFGGILLAGPIADLSTWTELLNALDELEEQQRPCCAIVEERLPNEGETETQYRLALEAIWANRSDNRVSLMAGECQYDPTTLRQTLYFNRRMHTAPFAARHVALRYEQSPALVDPIARAPGPTPSIFGGFMRGVRIYDDEGQVVGHDERNNPGLSDLRFVTTTSYPQEGVDAFVHKPYTMRPDGDTVYLLPIRRLANVWKRIVYFRLTQKVGSYNLRIPGQATISEQAANDLGKFVTGHLREELAQRVSGLSFEIDLTTDVSVPDPRVLWNGTLVTGFYIDGFDGVVAINQDT